jgi:hypothetical protein
MKVEIQMRERYLTELGIFGLFFCFSTQQGKDYKHLTEYLKKVMVVIKHSNKKKLRKE